MRTLSATEVSRHFSDVLDSLERGGEEIVIVRNKQPVARLIPGTPRMSAMEAFGDLHGTLDDKEGDDWLADMAKGHRLLAAETRDPWA